MSRTRVQLLGRLVADPELLYAPTGEGVARFVLAVSPYGPAAVDEDATRHRCVAWNLGGRGLADLVVDHLQAGVVVYVEGRLQMLPPTGIGQRIGQASPQILEDLAVRPPRTGPSVRSLSAADG